MATEPQQLFSMTPTRWLQTGQGRTMAMRRFDRLADGLDREEYHRVLKYGIAFHLKKSKVMLGTLVSY